MFHGVTMFKANCFRPTGVKIEPDTLRTVGHEDVPRGWRRQGSVGRELYALTPILHSSSKPFNLHIPRIIAIYTLWTLKGRTFKYDVRFRISQNVSW